PDFAEAHLDLGCQLAELQRYEEALQSYERAIALKPDYVEAIGNAASALSALGRSGEAIEWAQRALAINPEYIPALINLGNTQRALNRYQEAMATYDRALGVRPDDPLVQWNHSLALLAIGDFARGWPKYEARRSIGSKGVAPREWSRPPWNGKADLAEATILLHAEQGLGDTLQFARYVPLVARRAAAVALEVQRPLVRLLAGLRGVSSIHAQGDTLPQFSYHCPLMSLPLLLETTVDTIPAETPYVFPLLADVARWRPVIGDGSGKPQIGLVWAGNPGHRNDRQRSVELNLLRPLLQLTGVRFVALQRELRGGDAAILSDAGSVLSLGERLESLCDTAAVISQLDLVITVDTAVAHLAGAMGKPVWILLPFCPDFRWLLDREDSPWYPSARLFRQKVRGDWRSVVDDVGQALTPHLSGAEARLI
ncbi:MAG: glycosyltransferase family protein, partial [Alphaproteobacteria bacterium]|nr:glycosyltransferase family protein [Alphaproteobacteria bacterium]